MIQAAMMFALGFSVCGLIALAVSSALARRTRRLAEHRVKQRYATKRLEFETERDELRARHAVAVQRLERDVRRLGDEATAYRLESALKDIEINSLHSDVDSKDEEIDDLSDRLDELHEQLRESDRRLAESGTALRAARHALQMKSAEDALGDNPYAEADEHALINGHAGRAMAEDENPDAITLTETEEGVSDSEDDDSPATKNIRKVASEIRRIASETVEEIKHLHIPERTRSKMQEKASASVIPQSDPDPSVTPPPVPAQKADNDKAGKLVMFDPQRREMPPVQTDAADAENAENRFHQAMEQIRTLEKAGGSNAAE